MTPTLTILAATLAWCALHSLLLGDCCAGSLRRLGPRGPAWHRLLYNLFAGLSLVPLLLLYRAAPGETLWAWHGPWQLLRAAALLAAGALALGGVRAFDNRAFLGLRQIEDARAGRDPAPERIERRGVLGRVRHPYYASGLLILVAGLDFTTSNVVWRGLFVVYLLAGAAIEERRLLRRFGEEYAEYRRATPAFLPRLRRTAKTGDPRDVP